jgi:hypothetical protein
MEEEWRTILGYDYEVSNLGNVKNVKTGKILKCALVTNGYLQTTLYNKGQKRFKVHRLVLQTFNPTEEDLECNHKNHIKTDNRLCNLEWVSKSQNMRFRKKWKSLSKYKGVSFDKKKWRTQCSLNGKQIHLGYFDTEEEGAKAYNNFVIKNGLQDFNLLNDIQL